MKQISIMVHGFCDENKFMNDERRKVSSCHDLSYGGKISSTETHCQCLWKSSTSNVTMTNTEKNGSTMNYRKELIKMLKGQNWRRCPLFRSPLQKKSTNTRLRHNELVGVETPAFIYFKTLIN